MLLGVGREGCGGPGWLRTRDGGSDLIKTTPIEIEEVLHGWELENAVLAMWFW